MASEMFNQNSLLNITGLRSRIRQFFQWWIGELAFLIPVKYLPFIRKQSQPVLVLQYCQSSIGVYHKHPNGCDRIGTINLNDGEVETIDSALSSWLQETGVHLQPILPIPTNRVVRKDIVLPKVAVDNLDNVLVYELDRHTPFKSDQAYYDYVIDNKSAPQGLVNVSIYAVAKSFINKLLDIVEPFGLEPPEIMIAANMEAADPFSGQARIRLCHDESSASVVLSNKLQMALSVVLCCLTVAALFIPLLKMDATVSELRERLNTARKDVEEINKTRSDINAYVQKLHSLKEEKSSTSNVVDVLLELTSILPDDTWLENVALKDGGVTMQGQSASATELIRLLESSAIFSKAKFESPVVQLPGGLAERFNIRAEINRGQNRVE
jgi:general secretion pathway protein L